MQSVLNALDTKREWQQRMEAAMESGIFCLVEHVDREETENIYSKKGYCIGCWRRTPRLPAVRIAEAEQVTTVT